jgi:hypothetical protein
MSELVPEFGAVPQDWLRKSVIGIKLPCDHFFWTLWEKDSPVRKKAKCPVCGRVGLVAHIANSVRLA